MLVRFSNAYADQLEHLFKKLKNIDKPLIYNFDNNSAVQLDGQTIKFLKTKLPNAGICNTLFELAKKYNIQLEDFNNQKKKADAAISTGPYLENSSNFIDKIGMMYNSVKSSGYIVLSLPTCYNENWISFQPNLMYEIAKQNEVGLTYFRISDYSNNYESAVNIDITEESYKEIMHKYQHTYRTRMGTTFKKEDNNTKFIFKDPK